MDSLTHFIKNNVHFYLHYINGLKVTELDKFGAKKGWHFPYNQFETDHDLL